MQILIFSIFLRQPVVISATKPPNQILYSSIYSLSHELNNVFIHCYLIMKYLRNWWHISPIKGASFLWINPSLTIYQGIRITYFTVWTTSKQLNYFKLLSIKYFIVNRGTIKFFSSLLFVQELQIKFLFLSQFWPRLIISLCEEDF